MIWKFRAKCPICKNWHYGAIAFDGNLLIDEKDFSFKKVDPSTVGVYIGRKDKNGNEVYTGDVLRWLGAENENQAIHYIYYDENFGGFLIKYPPCEMPIDLDGDDFKEFEIIGNVHDNPELLEVYNG